MKNKKMLIAIAFLLAFAAVVPMVSPQESFASEQIGTATCTARKSMNIRQGAGTNTRVIGSLPARAQVPVYEQRGAWYRISYNGQSGWCHGDYLSVAINNGNAGAAIGSAVCLANNSMNIRQGSGTNTGIVGKLPARAEVSVYEQRGVWYRIQYNGIHGWCHGDYLRVTLSGGNSPSDGNENNNNSGTSSAIGTATCLAKNSMNIRQGAGTSTRVVGKLPARAQVSVYEQRGVWYRIQYNGTEGWCHGDYLNVNMASAPSEKPESTDKIGTALCLANNSMNIREGAGTNTRIVGKLLARAEVSVYEQRGVWYRISYNGLNGWCHGDYLRVTMTPAPKPEPTPTPTPEPTPLPDDAYSTFPFPANNRLAGKIVFIDPGHGSAGDGGSAGGSFAGYIEHKAMLEHGNFLKETLEKSGAMVVMTRTGERSVFNYTRVSMANRYSLEYLRGIRQTELDGKLDEKNQLETEKNTLDAETDSERIAEIDERLTTLGHDIRPLEDTIAELSRLEGVMTSVIENHDLAKTYYNSPYDYSHTRVIHPDLKRIFEYQRDPAIANNMVYISLHSNATASGDTSAQGTVIYRMNNSTNATYFTGYSTEKIDALGAQMYYHVAKAGGYNQRGNVVNDYFMVREINVPAVLIEIGFHTHAGDRAKLSDPLVQKRVCNGILQGLFTYFGV